MKKTLYRNMEEALLGGVLAGLADYLEHDATLIRIVFVVLMIVSGFMPCVLLYCLAWVLMPVKPKVQPIPQEDYKVYD